MDRVENIVYCCTAIVSVGKYLFAKALLRNSCVYLLIHICCVAADVVLLFVSLSLPSNGSTGYKIYIFKDPYRLLCHNKLILFVVFATFIFLISA
jgi:hypothetical protein